MTTDKQQLPSREVLQEALKEIQEYAGDFIGCRCDRDDCAPGDCWPCRMMHIIILAQEGLDNHEELK